MERNVDAVNRRQFLCRTVAGTALMAAGTVSIPSVLHAVSNENMAAPPVPPPLIFFIKHRGDRPPAAVPHHSTSRPCPMPKMRWRRTSPPKRLNFITENTTRGTSIKSTPRLRITTLPENFWMRSLEIRPKIRTKRPSSIMRPRPGIMNFTGKA